MRRWTMPWPGFRISSLSRHLRSPSRRYAVAQRPTKNITGWLSMVETSKDPQSDLPVADQPAIKLPESLVDGFDVGRAFAASVEPTGTAMSREQVVKRLMKIGQLIRLLRVRIKHLGADQTPMIAETGVWPGLSARVIALAVADIRAGWTGKGCIWWTVSKAWDLQVPRIRFSTTPENAGRFPIQPISRAARRWCGQL